MPAVVVSPIYLPMFFGGEKWLSSTYYTPGFCKLGLS
jgi:hypothetical protein